MATAAKKILLTLPGIGRVESNPGASFDPGGISFEGKMTESGRNHHMENDNPAMLSFTVPNLQGYLEQFRGLSDINVNVQDELGQSWIVTEAFITNTPKVSGGDIPIEMQGNPAEPV